jgi:fluoride exporter
LLENLLAPEIRAPILIGLGAIPGALSRYYLTLACVKWLGAKFPYGTFLINLTGSALIGFVAALIAIPTIADPDLQWLVSVGFLGSYTTFSTYALDTSNLLQARKYKTALFYWLGSSVLGLLSVELGMFLARNI